MYKNSKNLLKTSDIFFANNLLEAINIQNYYVILYPNRYNNMFFIEKTYEFDKWLRKQKDLKAKAKILFRIQKIESEGHFGDCKHVGNGIRELRINFSKGYRVYFKERNGKIIVLLIGGNKSTQQKDIEKAKDIWKEINK